jgi:hypothetical protein
VLPDNAVTDLGPIICKFCYPSIDGVNGQVLTGSKTAMKN